MIDTSTRNLMGTNTCGRWQYVTEPLIKLMADSGATNLQDFLRFNEWDAKLVSNGVKIQDRWKQIRNWTTQYGMTLTILGMPPWNPRDTTYTARLILNIKGLQDTFIASWKRIIAAIQPDQVYIIGEPNWWDSSGYKKKYSEAQYHQKYLDFCCRAYDEYKSVKPDLTIVVNGCPFWNLTNLAINPVPRDVIYAYNYYYSYDNKYPPSYEKPMVLYWNAKTPSELSDAKQAQAEYWMGRAGLGAMLYAKLPMMLGEVGTHQDNPNAVVFMQDLFDFAKSYNLGVIQYAMMPDNIYPHSILDGRTTNWQAGQPFPTKLNALGNVWAANMRAA